MERWRPRQRQRHGAGFAQRGGGPIEAAAGSATPSDGCRLRSGTPRRGRPAAGLSTCPRRKLPPPSTRASAVSVLPLSDQPATSTARPSISTHAAWSTGVPRSSRASCKAGRTMVISRRIGKPGSTSISPSASGNEQVRPFATTNSRSPSCAVTQPSPARFWSSRSDGRSAGSSRIVSGGPSASV